MKLSSALVLLFVFTLAACSGDPVAPKEEERTYNASDSVYFPLASGDWQIVQRTVYDIDMNIVNRYDDSLAVQDSLPGDDYRRHTVFVYNNQTKQLTDTLTYAGVFGGAYEYKHIIDIPDLTFSNPSARYLAALQMTKIGDFGKIVGEWENIDTMIVGLKVDHEGQLYDANAVIVQRFVPASSDSIALWDGKKVRTRRYSSSTLYHIAVPAIGKEFYWQVPEHYYFQMGRGLVRYDRETTIIVFPDERRSYIPALQTLFKSGNRRGI